jgi:hypothetical protein
MSQQMARKVVLSAAGFLLLITYVEFRPPWEKDLRFLAQIRYAFLAAFFIAMGSFLFDAADRSAGDTLEPVEGPGAPGLSHYLVRMSLLIASLLTFLAFAALVFSFITSEPIAADTLPHI